MPNSFSLPLPRKTIILALAMFFMATTHVFAEVVRLTSGKSVEGEIILRNEELIKIDTGSGILVTYYIDEISSIDDEPVAPIEKVKEIGVPKEIEAPKIIDPAEKVKIPEKITVTENTKPVVKTVISEESAIPEKEKVNIEISPAKDVATLDGVNVFKKEPPSPIAIKPKESRPINRSSGAVEGVEGYLTKRIQKELGKTEAHAVETDQKKESMNAIFRKVDWYIKTQIQSFKEARVYFQQKLPFIKEKLSAVPVKIRRDIFLLIIIVAMVIYILTCFPLMQIAKKLGRKWAWLIWIPVIQIFYFLRMADKPLWWVIFFFVPILNFFILLLLFVDILKLLKKSFLLIIPIIIPGVNIFTLWYLAISKTRPKLK